MKKKAYAVNKKQHYVVYFASNLQNQFSGSGKVFGLTKGNRFWSTCFTPFKCSKDDIIIARVIIPVGSLTRVKQSWPTIHYFQSAINKVNISTKTFHIFILKTGKESFCNFLFAICKQKIKDKTEMWLRQDKWSHLSLHIQN